jgi:putative NADH-flavin reductase/pimeloyl-ACP methyl ester carboxylesterase
MSTSPDNSAAPTMTRATAVTRVAHRHADVDGLKIFYREVEAPAGTPTLLLLHGFPSASHQFRRLIDVLGGRFRLIAPDYPGFGYSDAPSARSAGGSFDYSFDSLADVVERFCRAIGLDRFALYVFDFGAPVGFRLATRHPDWIAGLVVQNGNVYEAGLSPLAREITALRRGEEGSEARIRELLTLSATRDQYLHGAREPDTIAPDGWTLDHHFLELPGRKQIQLDLMFGYHRNIELYPSWQAWLREHRPPTLVVWGRNDPFFVEAGARAFKDDVPDAEVHLLDTGHFALEERVDVIAPLVASFVERKWSAPSPIASAAPLRLAVIGASGHLGGAVAREAIARGHAVTAIARRAGGLRDLDGARAVEADVLDVDAMTELLAGHDAVVAALKGRHQREVGVVPDGARALLAALPRAEVRRLLFVGGGGSLLSPAGERFVDSAEFPAQYKPDALAQAQALEILRDADGALDWSYASPPPVQLVDGERTGRYRVRAGDLPIVDADGHSRISVPDYAAAIVDALEARRFIGERFTAAY